jgi:hypothetical protein
MYCCMILYNTFIYFKENISDSNINKDEIKKRINPRSCCS